MTNARSGVASLPALRASRCPGERATGCGAGEIRGAMTLRRPLPR